MPLGAVAIEDGTGDRALLRSVLEVVDRRLDDPDLDIDAVAHELGQSRRTLYRRFEDTGDSPAERILRHRLERAKDLLAGGHGNVSEVAYAVGFRSVSHFSRRLRAHHGASPSSFRPRPGA